MVRTARAAALRPAFVLAAVLSSLSPPAAGLEVAVSFDEKASPEPVDGRVLLLVATDGEREPRFQVGGRLSSAQVFGIDVDGLKPGESAVIGSGVFGYPIRDLADLPPGEYHVQGLLHRYETFRPAHGHTVKLPMDRGEGQHWNRAPGNLYSEPRRMRLDPSSAKRVEIRLDQVIPPVEEPEDTRYVRHVKIQSKLLTEFWGRPISPTSRRSSAASASPGPVSSTAARRAAGRPSRSRSSIPGHRNYLGEVTATIESSNHVELALGTNSRSGDQYDIWQAVYSPVGEDGYPKPIWDKETGAIDREVARYWRENYDLRHILERDWKTLGPKLEGKIHVYCGDMDNYYLNNAVYLMEEFLESTKEPYYGGEVDYGDRAEHCWNGDRENPNHVSRLRYNWMYLPKILKRIEESAPPGADLVSWRY